MVSHLVILGPIMVDIHGIELVQNQVEGVIPIGMILEVATDIVRIMVQAGALLWEGRAGAPSVGKACATQGNAAHFPRTNVHAFSATYVLPRCTTELLLTVFFRNCPPLHSHSSV